jgi:HAMP domain-containing protein
MTAKFLRKWSQGQILFVAPGFPTGSRGSRGFMPGKMATEINAMGQRVRTARNQW